MVKEIARQVEIPEGVAVTVDGNTVTVKGPKGEISRQLSYPEIEIRKEDSHLVVNSRLDRKRQRAMVGTLAAHIRNMIKGVTEGYEYKMKVVYSHFPIQLKAAADELIINNFLGERKPRSAKILPGTKVNLGKDEVVITGIDKEHVGQTMANIEQATRVRGFDIRIFQDGIYLVDKR
ncbi:MAG: 50S ribosomal protein L6 [Methanosaeta sp. PtaB.Bin018]|jgi:large subunit ribosomal protein L6|nr:50S ribosomal protein L6 [Methanothrix sp.]OPX76003.1 MAG: 50S ribosomal protein L6 [Methanosaeta sp. PtaB.Bin018]OPY43283.1 MAG: 50S ribosomal protein L6 [Methanosaeta sp. PtaU1.Bin016]